MQDWTENETEYKNLSTKNLSTKCETEKTE